MQIKDILEKAILDAANAIIEDGIFKLAETDKLPDVLLEVPPKKEFGDFATNFAMQSAKIFHSNPRKIAEEIKNRIKLDQIEKIEIAGAGFLNFYLKSTVIYDNFRHTFQVYYITLKISSFHIISGKVCWYFVISTLKGEVPTP